MKFIDRLYLFCALVVLLLMLFAMTAKGGPITKRRMERAEIRRQMEALAPACHPVQGEQVVVPTYAQPTYQPVYYSAPQYAPMQGNCGPAGFSRGGRRG